MEPLPKASENAGGVVIGSGGGVGGNVGGGGGPNVGRSPGPTAGIAGNGGRGAGGGGGGGGGGAAGGAAGGGGGGGGRGGGVGMPIMPAPIMPAPIIPACAPLQPQLQLQGCPGGHPARAAVPPRVARSEDADPSSTRCPSTVAANAAHIQLMPLAVVQHDRPPPRPAAMTGASLNGQRKQGPSVAGPRHLLR